MSIFWGIILSAFGISIMQLILTTAMPYIAAEIGSTLQHGAVVAYEYSVVRVLKGNIP